MSNRVVNMKTRKRLDSVLRSNTPLIVAAAMDTDEAKAEETTAKQLEDESTKDAEFTETKEEQRQES